MTVASDSLKDARKTKPTTTAEVEALAAFMKLAPEHKKRTFEFLQKALDDDDNAVWTKAGVGADYAKKNRDSHKPGGGTSAGADKLKTLKKEEFDELMQEAFPEFTEELREKFAEVFFRCVGKASLRDGLLELFTENPEFKLLFNEDDMDVARLLHHYCEELENDIAMVEEENAMLAAQIVESQTIFEEALFAPHQKSKKAKRSYIDEDFEPDESNAILMESQEKNSGDWKMRKRVQYLENTTKGVDQHGVNDGLLEAWNLNNK